MQSTSYASRSVDIGFFAAGRCVAEGSKREYYHSDAGRVNPRDCWYWFNGNWVNPECSFRHQVSEPLGIGQTFLVSHLLLAPENLHSVPLLDFTPNDIQLLGVIWPGQTAE